jgi:hypothetical protein
LSEIFEKSEAPLTEGEVCVTLAGQNFELLSGNRMPIGLSQIRLDIDGHNHLILKVILPF